MTYLDPAQNRLIKQHAREGGGCIVTFWKDSERVVRVFEPPLERRPRRGRSGNVVAGEPKGSLRAAVRLAADYCRTLGPEWRICSISTPSSIYGDLLGRHSGRAEEVGLLKSAGCSSELYARP